MCPPYKKAAQATAAVLPIDFQETSTLNEVKQDDSSEAMVRVYQPPVVNNSRGQTSGQQSINGFQVLFYNTRNPASRASKRARLVAMYIAVAIRPRVLLIQ